MSRWSKFLTTISSEEEITLVGPLYHAPHSPTMPTIYVDGGSRFRSNGGGWAPVITHSPDDTDSVAFPAISVGDGDSSAGSLDEVLPAEKDYSDLAFVLRSLPASIRAVTLLGFLGGRRDHELANLGETHEFLKSRTQATRADFAAQGGERIIAFARGTLALNISGQFTVFVLEAAEVKITGRCRYTLPGPVVLQPLSSRGLSNEGDGAVQIESPSPVFVFVSQLSS